MSRVLALTAAVLLGAAVAAPLMAPASADVGTEKPVGETTIWDQIMAQQSVRHLQEGAEAFARGDYALATQYFARAVASNPDDYRTYLMFGVANYWSGKVDEAMAAYRQVLKIDPKNAEAHQLLGIAYAWKDDVPNALKEFELSAQLDPNRPDIQMDLGSVYETVGRSADAMDCLRRAVELDPKYPLYYYQLGALYDRLGREQDAMDSMRQALHLYSDFQDALLEQGSLRQRAGDLEGAAASFKKAVKLKPGDSVARLRLAYVHLLEKRADLIPDDLEHAFDLTPESEGGRLALSQAYHGSQKPSDDDNGPLSMFRKNLERIPPGQGATVEAEITRVQIKPYSFETPEEGTATLKTANQQPTNAPTATRTVRDFTLDPGTPEQRLSQIQQIISELGKAMKDTPPGVDTHLGMNITYTHKNTDQDQQQDVHPVSYEPRRVGNDLGLWVQGTGWVDLVHEAVPDLEQRLASQPSDMDTALLLGLAHLTLGEPDDAAAAFQTALDRQPRDVEALLGLGVARVIGGQDDDALAVYRRVLSIQPRNRTAKDAVRWLTTPLPKSKTAVAAKPSSAPSH